MASKKNEEGRGHLFQLTLRPSKDTKGTYVYTMVTEAGIEIGGVYLQKLLFAAGKPAGELVMTVSDKASAASAE